MFAVFPQTQLICLLPPVSQALEAAGCIGLVVECVPPGIAAALTQELTIPTIGIGAGPHCSGQVPCPQLRDVMPQRAGFDTPQP